MAALGGNGKYFYMESWHDLPPVLGKLAGVFSSALYHGYVPGFIPQQALWAQGTNTNLHLRKKISREKSPKATSGDVMLISQEKCISKIQAKLLLLFLDILPCSYCNVALLCFTLQ